MIVVVTAAETVVHGGPAALLAASGRETLRAAGAYSLLETSASQGWQLAVAIERELSRRVPVIGASLTLNHPRLGGAARGYPYEQEALDRIAGSALRRPFGLLPDWTRDRLIRSVRRELSLAAAYGGHSVVEVGRDGESGQAQRLPRRIVFSSDASVPFAAV